MPENKVIFRCDGSPEIGSGHVMRCLSLARFLKLKNFECIFWVSKETLQNINALSKSGFKSIHAVTDEKCDWLVVDHYGLDADFEKSHRYTTKKIMVIDDLANRKHDCDLLLDQTLGRIVSDYSKMLPAHTKQLLGPQYAIISEKFASVRRHLEPREYKKANSVLICFGGVNPKHATEKTISYLSKYTKHKLNINVAFGGNEHTFQAISKAADNTPHNVTLMQNAQNMQELMSCADLSIGAGGTMSWERCALALPALTMELADNQSNVLKQLDDIGAIRNLGLIENLTEDDFLKIFTETIENSDYLEKMSKIAGRICDARGNERIFCHLMKPSFTKLQKSVTIRMAQEQDSDIVYKWQCEPDIRKFSRNVEIPEYDAHIQWFKNKIAEQGAYFFIINIDDNPCGVGRLDPKELDGSKKTYEVSILISQKFQKQGIAKAALDQLAKYRPNDKLIAEILPKNTASIEVFKAAGYIQHDKTWYALKR